MFVYLISGVLSCVIFTRFALPRREKVLLRTHYNVWIKGVSLKSIFKALGGKIIFNVFNLSLLRK